MTRIQHTTVLTLGMMVALLTGVGVIAAAAALESVAPSSRAYLHGYNLDSSGLALEGYCPVSYHTRLEARPGSPEFTSTYNGVDYRFASAAAKRAFDSNPQRYLPAYGGWCAFGMAIEDKFPVDPTNFKIVDGRLMVFLRNTDIDALDLWNQNDEQAQAEKADAFWETLSQ